VPPLGRAARELERRIPSREKDAEYGTVLPMTDAAKSLHGLTRGGKHLFTDYQLLYRFDDGWRIVSKVFHSHA
jgi:hypothetical protein